MTQQEMFGGVWTEQKLTALKRYLAQYTRIFTKNPRARFFTTHYVDAFAGTGYMQRPEISTLSFFPELSEGAEEYTKGSAVRALEVDPPFDHYLFIEQHSDRAAELLQLKTQYPNRASRIDVLCGDASRLVQQWCRAMEWKKNRAVMFLDPFGMEVDWSLLEIIAATHGVDLWYLFPIFAVNRLLVNEKEPPESWAERLTSTLGTPTWREEFYSTEAYYSLLGGSEPVRRVIKTANVQKISDFFIARLRSIFFKVSNPLVLRNSKECPLYLLVFAAGNAKGADAGLKIANHLVGG